MNITALTKLQHRSEQLTTKLAYGTKTEVAAAREMLRLSLVELHELGHWQQHPEEMRRYMRLFRASGCRDTEARSSDSNSSLNIGHSRERGNPWPDLSV